MSVKKDQESIEAQNNTVKRAFVVKKIHVEDSKLKDNEGTVTVAKKKVVVKKFKKPITIRMNKNTLLGDNKSKTNNNKDNIVTNKNTSNNAENTNKQNQSNTSIYKKDSTKKYGSGYENRNNFRNDKAEAARRQETKIYNKLQAKKLQQEQRLKSVEKDISILETITVGDLAKKMNLRASDIISKLISMGTMARVNDVIDSDTATIIADDFGCKVNVISLEEEASVEVKEDDPKDLKPRSPVVTIMGHVDHGKTSLLDVIRHSNITSLESGGITQNIGAYQVVTNNGSVTFIDTPGHEAFSMMRIRGAKSTDIVILVVAADDGVMPQTVEALNHAKTAEVPIIVAVNKMDIQDASMDKIKSKLTEYGLTPEEWGGDTQYIPVSALKKTGIDELLEAIILQAELLELKANPNRSALGIVLEASLDSGRGSVGTVLVQNGTLKIGDYFVCGLASGKVRAMVDDMGVRVKEAGPSTPVEVLGFEKTPLAGDDFYVVSDDKEARSLIAKREILKQHDALKTNVRVTLENLYEKIASDAMQEFKVIIKSDVQGSAEALRDALSKIQSDKIRFTSIYSASGSVSESDVNLAHASNAMIIAYRVRPSAKARDLAEKLDVTIEKYDIIYEAIESIENAMRGSLEKVKKEVEIGSAEVRETFKIPKVGVIAGCYVTSGKVERNALVRIIRDGVLIYTSKVASLKRLKDDVKEVNAGYECGVSVENFNDIKKEDVLEIFTFEEVSQEL